MDIQIFACEHTRPARIMLVRVAPSFVEGWFTESPKDDFQSIRVDEGLPKGARLVRLVHDATTNELVLAFEHESFPTMTIGALPPYFNVAFQIQGKSYCGRGHECPACKESASC